MSVTNILQRCVWRVPNSHHLTAVPSTTWAGLGICSCWPGTEVWLESTDHVNIDLTSELPVLRMWTICRFYNYWTSGTGLHSRISQWQWLDHIWISHYESWTPGNCQELLRYILRRPHFCIFHLVLQLSHTELDPPIWVALASYHIKIVISKVVHDHCTRNIISLIWTICNSNSNIQS